jgi:kynurenine 3-monooxygenase
MVQSEKPRITLIGGGLAGGLLATYLGRAGHDVTLYERRSDPGAGNFVGGRSINLALSTRGIDALQRVGLADEILAHAIQMRGRMIHDRAGGLHFQPYDKDPAKCINSIGRAALNSVTLAAAQKLPNVKVLFDHKCVDVELDRPAARLVNTMTNADDGAFSAVRKSMQRLERFDYRQDYLRHGYKELTIPPGPGGEFRMERNALHIWPRRSFMMIALPNPDGSFTCTLFYPYEGAASFDALRSDDDVRRFFESEFPDAIPLMPTLLADYRANPTGAMVTVRCRPWQHEGRVALVGDAAHAVVPFYGQGMNAAFEDVVALDESFRRHGPDWRRVFEAYETSRKANCDALADLAIGNFIEMRDKTASRAFRIKKKVERTLHALLPGLYLPLYSMVSFSCIPYAEAVQRAGRQDKRVFVVSAMVAMFVLAIFFRWMTSDRLVACFSMAATLVYVAMQVIIYKTKHRETKM